MSVTPMSGVGLVGFNVPYYGPDDSTNSVIALKENG